MVEVEILDVRIVWSRTDVFIKPLAGTGSLWVAESSVKKNLTKEPIPVTL